MLWNVTAPVDPSEVAGSNDASRRMLVFGGTFDPPHLAHTQLAELAAGQLECDEILFIPAAISPLKDEAPGASKEHRIAMLLLATADIPGARISTIELDRQGKSFTIDTLRELAKSAVSEKQSAVPSAATSAAARIVNRQSSIVNPPAPQAPSLRPEFFLLIGADQALEFHRWKDWQQILTLARPAVMLRRPWNEESFAAKLREIYSPLEAEHWMSWTLRLPLIDVSATEVRRRLQHHEATQGFLHPAVAEYIHANKLYETADERG